MRTTKAAEGDNGEHQRLIRTIPRRGVRFVGVVRIEEKPANYVAEELLSKILPDEPSIAVLPFANMSGDDLPEYFADGIVEEIITALSRFSSLFVIARNSSFTYKGRAVDVKQVGRELGVRYVLEGSVRKGGQRARITGQLIDAATGAHIWADRFDGAYEDVFDLQDQGTASVVASISPKIEQVAGGICVSTDANENPMTTLYVVRSMTATEMDRRAGKKPIPYHIYLLPREHRANAYWTASVWQAAKFKSPRSPTAMRRFTSTAASPTP
jgi:TolB-like protein